MSQLSDGSPKLEVTSDAPKTDKPVVLRAPDGTFAKGSTGGPGRPKGTRNHLVTLQRDLEIAVREHLGVAKVKRVIDKVFELAEGGNIHACKLLLDKIISNASTGEETAENGRTVVFRIENATFAAKQESSPESKPKHEDAIEAEFTHVPH